MSDNDDFMNQFLFEDGEFSPDIFSDIYARPLTDEELTFLLSQYPFLDLCHPDFDFETETLPVEPTKVWYTDSQWCVQELGSQRLLCGPGNRRLGRHPTVNAQIEKSDGDEGGRGGNRRRAEERDWGTLQQRGIVAVEDLLSCIHQKGWGGFRIITGHEVLQRAAWMLAEEYQLAAQDFYPSDEDEQQRQRVLTARKHSRRGGAVAAPIEPE